MSNLYNEMIEFARENIAPFTTQVDVEGKFPGLIVLKAMKRIKN